MLRSKVESVYRTMPALETQRLLLRKLEKSDAEALYAFSHIPEVSRYLLWDTHPTLKYTKSYLHDLMKSYRDFLYFEWGVVEKESGTLIGTCGFTSFDYAENGGEIGYSFHPAYWGHGYATEATIETIRFGFRILGLKRIYAYYVLENEASLKVLLHSGMTFRREVSPLMIKGQEMRIGLCDITRDEYASQAVRSLKNRD